MASPGNLTIVATGDVIPTRPLGREEDWTANTQRAFAELRAADIAFGSLETPLTDRGEPWDKIVLYRSSPSLIDDVARMGFDVVSLANNQTLNYGYPGLEQTMQLLEAHEIAHVGAGPSADAAWDARIVSKGGVRVAFVAFTCVAPLGWAATADRGGLAAIRVRTAYEVDAKWVSEEPGVVPRVKTWVEEAELAPVRRAVARARTRSDLVIVGVHWGVGSTAHRADYQEQLAKVLVEAGATCVLGSHAPPVQGVDVLDRAFISYSQGTFIRQQPRPAALKAVYDAMPRSGYLLRLAFESGGRARATLLPTLLDANDVSGMVGGAVGDGILDEVFRRSPTDSYSVIRRRAGASLRFR